MKCTSLNPVIFVSGFDSFIVNRFKMFNRIEKEFFLIDSCLSWSDTYRSGTALILYDTTSKDHTKLLRHWEKVIFSITWTHLLFVKSAAFSYELERYWRVYVGYRFTSLFRRALVPCFTSLKVKCNEKILCCYIPHKKKICLSVWGRVWGASEPRTLTYLQNCSQMKKDMPLTQHVLLQNFPYTTFSCQKVVALLCPWRLLILKN